MCVFFRLGTIVCCIQNFHSKQCYLFIVGFYCHSVPKYQCVHELSNFVDCCCADDVVFLAVVSAACSVWCCCHFRQISMMAFVLHIFFFAFLFYFPRDKFLALTHSLARSSCSFHDFFQRKSIFYEFYLSPLLLLHEFNAPWETHGCIFFVHRQERSCVLNV